MAVCGRSGFAVSLPFPLSACASSFSAFASLAAFTGFARARFGLLIGLPPGTADWYGLTISALRCGGVTSLIRTSIIPAAFDFWRGEPPSLDESSPFQVCLRGEGTAGKLGFFGVRAAEGDKRLFEEDDEATPFLASEDLDGPGVWIDKFWPSAARPGVGAGPGERGGGFFAGVLKLKPFALLLAVGKVDCPSSLTRLRLPYSRL